MSAAGSRVAAGVARSGGVRRAINEVGHALDITTTMSSKPGARTLAPVKRRAFLAGGGALLLAGCTSTPTPATTPDASATAATAEPTPSPTPEASTKTPATPPPDERSGEGLAVPYEVDGIIVVSPAHRVSAAYVPAWAERPNGLLPDAAAGFTALAAAAQADGLALSLRSGYRSYATQKASFERALRTYPEETARRYYAEPGASEHQTGLSLDAWDGSNRGSAFARTPQAAWLAAHATTHGFIVRYPQDKTTITGYAWESWHLRWVGTEVSAAFAPDPSLTLEEFLGLA